VELIPLPAPTLTGLPALLPTDGWRADELIDEGLHRARIVAAPLRAGVVRAA
jgi:hypothetical protein